MRRASSIVAAIAVLAALFHSGPEQALACLCLDADVSKASAAYADSDAIVVAHLAEGQTSADPFTFDLQVEHSYKGPSTPRLTVVRRAINSCDYTALSKDESHFVMLEASGDGTYKMPHLCGSFPVSSHDGEVEVPSAEYRQRFVSAIERESLIAAGLAPRDASDTDVGFIAVYVGASLIALAGLYTIAPRART